MHPAVPPGETAAMRIAIPLFGEVTALDAVGPYEVLQRIPGAEVAFVGLAEGPVRTDHGMLGLVVDAPLEAVPEPDVLVVPGGNGVRAFFGDERTIPWLRHAHETTRITASVCTGSLALAAAGVLDGVEATTHWACTDELRSLGAVPVDERVVRRGKVATAAGVSSGIDLALHLAAELADETTARAIQLMVEYDPEPPFDSGSSAAATPEVRARAAEIPD